LTVLALLSIFAVVLVGFTYTIRMEENTIRQYADSVTVQESTEAAIQGVLAQLARDLDPSKPNFVLGRPQPKYTSLLDPWAYGYAGTIGKNLSYDARSKELDVRPQKVYNRSNLRFLPTPIPRGVDEDPPGDVTGMQGIMRRGQGDGAPGLKNVDDDLDGRSMAARLSTTMRITVPTRTIWIAGGMGIISLQAPATIRMATGWECLTSAPKSILILPGIISAGEQADVQSRRFSHRIGSAGLFVQSNRSVFQFAGGLTNFNTNTAEQLANAIVSFRYGSVMDHGGTPGKRPDRMVRTTTATTIPRL
jgi:hypothetical protein